MANQLTAQDAWQPSSQNMLDLYSAQEGVPQMNVLQKRVQTMNALVDAGMPPDQIPQFLKGPGGDQMVAEMQRQKEAALQKQQQAAIKQEVETAEKIYSFDPDLGAKYWASNPTLSKLGTVSDSGGKDFRITTLPDGTEVMWLKKPGENKWERLKDEDKNLTREQLNKRSLEVGTDGKPTARAKEAQSIIDKMAKEDIKKAEAGRNVIEKAEIRKEERAESKGFQSWSQEEKNSSFETYRWTGKKPTFGFRDVASRNKWEQGLNNYMLKSGGPRKFAADQAKFKADTASYQNVKKASDMTDVAIKQTDNNAEALQKASDNYARSDFPAPNRIINLTAEQIGTPERQAQFAKFKLALMAFSREYMRVVTGAARSVAELTVGAQQSADDILSKFSSWEVLKAQVEQAKVEINNVHQAYGDTLTQQSVDLYGKDPKTGAPPSDYKPFDIKLPAGISAEGIAAELEKRRKK